jgi:hypothetical protein
MARQGKARIFDLAILLLSEAGRGMAGRGRAWRGVAMHGAARCGEARSGKVRRGVAGLGRVRQRKARFFNQ